MEAGEGEEATGSDAGVEGDSLVGGFGVSFCGLLDVRLVRFRFLMVIVVFASFGGVGLIGGCVFVVVLVGVFVMIVFVGVGGIDGVGGGGGMAACLMTSSRRGEPWCMTVVESVEPRTPPDIRMKVVSRPAEDTEV